MLEQEKENKDLNHDHVQEDVIDHHHLIIEDHVIDHLIIEIDHDHVQIIQDEIIIIGIIIIIIIHHRIKHQDIQIHTLTIIMTDITIMLHLNHEDMIIKKI